MGKLHYFCFSQVFADCLPDSSERVVSISGKLGYMSFSLIDD